MEYKDYAGVEFGDYMLPIKKKPKFEVPCDLHPKYFPEQEVPVIGRDAVASKGYNACYDCKRERHNAQQNEKRRLIRENKKNEAAPTE